MRPRGTPGNPPNRFERQHVEIDAEFRPAEEDLPDAELIRDPSRSIVATNDSPDVPFDASVNPYRGCQHACSYCLDPDTPVLHADFSWRPIGEVRPGDVLAGFDEHGHADSKRRLRPSIVRAVWWSRKATVRMIGRSREILTTAEHRWLTSLSRWRPTERLGSGSRIKRIPQVPLETIDDDYRAGYVSGMTLGDGTFRYEPGWRSDKLGFPAAYWRVALREQEPLLRLIDFLAAFGIRVELRSFDPGPRSPSRMFKVETRALGKLAVLRRIIREERDTRSWKRGFIAGFFDAEGHNGTSLRISQKDLVTLERVRKYLSCFGFDFDLEVREDRTSTIRLPGGIAERIRFFSVFQTALRRKRNALFGWMVRHEVEELEAIEPGPVADVVDIETSTHTFYAAGLASHNCFARPFHEYLGYSAGLDFETKILFKPEAPALLRRALASPRWRPRVLALSGVTDCYQPAERKLRITRGCLEVLAEFRNPTTIVTKGWLVVRDLDLLAELAAHDAASVIVSVTTLDRGLQRILEPGAATPARRLEAIERLAAAGVPVGALVAPVIPAVNDHEVPAIVEAVASAGAGWASKVMLRLPHAVAPLFEEWLDRHLPERKKKVLSKVRSMRNGELYDARFGKRQTGEGVLADHTEALFALALRRHGIARSGPELSTAAFRRPGGEQLGLL